MFTQRGVATDVLVVMRGGAAGLANLEGRGVAGERRLRLISWGFVVLMCCLVFGCGGSGGKGRGPSGVPAGLVSVPEQGGTVATPSRFQAP